VTRSADSDRPGWRTLARRRQADRDFIAKLPHLTADELRDMLDGMLPTWRRVAIARALVRT